MRAAWEFRELSSTSFARAPDDGDGDGDGDDGAFLKVSGLF
jgi:hypothetical protein